ncbi:MAG TPA: hypothetical protein VF490_03230 [Chryseosolibacter sp.]
MEPIPYEYEAINRNAILIRPKKPFFDWLNAIRKGQRPLLQEEENNIYLIREMESNEHIKKWIQKHFDNIFVNELNDWYTDESGWPENRTYQMFIEWFDVEIHSMVLDLEKSPVRKD